jgi:ADP-heptose:LPS heptosyltransferase
MSAGRIEGVERIAVLRPNAVGDFIFTLPALAALRAAYPDAHITLLGKRWHREFLSGRPGPWDEVIEVPPVRGVGAEPEGEQDEAQIDAFVEAMRARRFDLVLQLYGGGRYSNPFVQRLGARVSVGAYAHDAPPLDRSVPYVAWCNERLRLLEVVAQCGARPVDLSPALQLTGADEQSLARQLELPPGPLVVLQPGASDPRRRWPVESFAAVGDALAARGAHIVINGSADERELVATLVNAMHAPAIDATRLPLGALAALLRRAKLVVSNDTGPLHLAQAVGTATVGIYWFLNMVTASPAVTASNRIAFSSRTHCPVCGAENVRGGCEHDASFVADVEVDEVLGLALELFNVADAPPAGSALR